jgi:hypothetical protein
MPFLKEDLVGDHYNWNEGKERAFTGNPSRRSFNRYDGQQVLFLINFYGSIAEKFTVKEGREMEERILKQLPLELKSEISVFNWLRASWR